MLNSIKLSKNIITKIALFLICFYQVHSCANPTDTGVNVLTWWGYLTSPWVHQMIRDKCHTDISYDEYNTNDEFIRRFRERSTQYDIVIFPNIDYKMLNRELNNPDSNLYQNAKGYETYIRMNYEKQNYAHNVVYFQLSTVGFLWNPKTINLSNTDSIFALFKKAGTNRIVLVDDPLFIYFALNSHIEDIEKIDITTTLKQFKNLTKNLKLFFTNEFSDMYGKPDFAFAYTWPGIAIYAIKNKYKDYQYLIHPELSIVWEDLLVAINNKPLTACVANVMASKEFLTRMQNDALYISPYKDLEDISDPTLKKFIKNFFISLPKLKWQNANFNEADFDAINLKWKYFKLQLNASHSSTL